MSAAVEAYLQELQTSASIREKFRQFGLPYAWLALGTVMLAMVASLLAATIINVAIAPIMGAFGIGQDKAQWLSTANLAAATVGMLLTAWLTSTWGIRATVVSAMALFTGASLLGGVSPNLELLTFARLLQGLASGIIFPLTASVVFQLFPHHKVGIAMAISSIGGILIPAAGPAIGGLIIDSFNWRYVFFLSVPFSGLALFLALEFLPDRDADQPYTPFDWIGLTALSLAISTLLIGLSNGEREGWASGYIIACMATAVLAWLFFIFWQMHIKHPLLNLAIFRNIEFSLYALVAFIFGAGLYASTYLGPLFLQLVQARTATEAGGAMLPAGLAMALAVPLCTRLSAKYHPRVPILLGSLAVALSFYLMHGGDADTGFWTFVWWAIIGRIGVGLAVPSMNLGALQSVSAAAVGQASGAINFARQLGGAFGVNLLSIEVARRTQFHMESIIISQGSDNSVTTEWLARAGEILVPLGMDAGQQQMAASAYLAQALAQEAVTLSFKDGFFLGALAFLIIVIPGVLIGRVRNNPKSQPINQ